MTRRNVYRKAPEIKLKYFAKHLLSLIMEENPDIHEYVEGLTPVRQAIFEREVLPRIIARHTQAIHPENIEQTEQTFIHNPQIKEALQRSDDFFIKAFTSGQIDTFERAKVVKDEDTLYSIIWKKGRISKQWVKIKNNFPKKILKIISPGISYSKN